MEHRKDIDGLRAVAVLPVLLFHAGFSVFSGGFVGVDVFFVISGYLITGIIVRELAEQRFSLMRFYERRARRILPALIVVALFSTILSFFIMLPGQWRDFGQSLIAVSLFASNILFWQEEDYFASASEEKPLLHTWSLAVEEQYYILFPLLLLAIWRFGRNPVGYSIVGLAIISFLAGEWGWRNAPTANFYLLTGRAWEILTGGACALYIAKRQRKQSELLTGIGLTAVLASIFLYDTQTPFPSFYTIWPVIGTCMMLLYGGGEGRIARILSAPKIVFLGLISYSLYLWHQPLFALRHLIWFGENIFLQIVLILLACVLAYASYIYVEVPARFRLWKNRSSLFLVGISVLALATLGGLGGLAVHYGNGKIDTIPKYAGADVGWEETQNAPTPDAPKILLYGDSHARQYAAEIARFARTEGVGFEFQGHHACISLPDLTNFYQGRIHQSCIEQLGVLERTLAAAKQEGTPIILVIAHRWGPRLARPDGTAIGQAGADEDNVARNSMATALRSLLDPLEADQPVLLVGNVPGAHPAGEAMQYGPARCQQYWNADCPDSFARGKGEMQAWNQALFAMGEWQPHAAFADPYDALCTIDICRTEQNGSALYSDDAHLSIEGAALVVAEMAPILRQLIVEAERAAK